jgi:DNA-binding NtrC family response regulator
MGDPLTDEDLRLTFEKLGFVASTVMLRLLQRARKAAEVSDVTILLEGETGTGKQVLAQAIHQRGPAPFTAVFLTSTIGAPPVDLSALPGNRHPEESFWSRIPRG